jgi:regulator of protease activity HflC (stomatin/prohibitin superfamily)
MLRRIFRRVARFIDRHLIWVLLGSVTAVMIAIVLWPYAVINIPSGSLGIRWSRFGGGTVMNKVYREGIQVIFPWDKMYLYDVRLQRMTHSLEILAKDSLKVQVTVDFVYRPNELLLPYIHKFVGPDYPEKVLVPVISFETRNAFANFNPDTGLTLDRVNVAHNIEQEVNQYLLERFNPPTGTTQELRYIAVEGVLINDVTLPVAVSDAIAAKDAAREKAEAYTYLLQIERREAQRKAIEAQGIKQFSENVGNGLTDNYLKLKQIEALLEIAKSPNGKIIVLGGSGGGGGMLPLPLVLGADGAPISGQTPSVPSSPGMLPAKPTVAQPAMPPTSGQAAGPAPVPASGPTTGTPAKPAAPPANQPK